MSEDFHEEIRKFSTSFLSLYSHGKEVLFAVYRFEFFRGEKSLWFSLINVVKTFFHDQDWIQCTMLNRTDSLMSLFPCQKLMDMCRTWLSWCSYKLKLHKSSLELKQHGRIFQSMRPWCFDFVLDADQRRIVSTWFEIGPQYSPGIPRYKWKRVERKSLQAFAAPLEHRFKVQITDFPRADKNWQC